MMKRSRACTRICTATIASLFALFLLAGPATVTADEVKPPGTATPPAETKPAAPAAADQKTTEQQKKEASARIGYVEMSRFAGESATGKLVRAQLQAKSDTYRTQMTAKQKQLEKQKDALQEKMPTLSPKQREAKAKEFEKKVDEYQKFAKKADRDLMGLEEDLSKKLYKEIEDAARAYGRANGYSAIVVKKELLYVGDAVEAKDVTEEVLKLMPKGEKK